MGEWNSQFLGDRAFQFNDPEKTNLRWEAKQWQARRMWAKWNYPFNPSSPYSWGHKEQDEVWAKYITDNSRRFRTWGISARNAWGYSVFWELRGGVNGRRGPAHFSSGSTVAPRGRAKAEKSASPLAAQDFKVDWNSLQKPGLSPDYLTPTNNPTVDTAFERNDWIPTQAAGARLANNMPLLAYIAGKPAHFTTKEHNYLAGQTVQKQILVINDSRTTVGCESSWSLALPGAREWEQETHRRGGATGANPDKLRSAGRPQARHLRARSDSEVRHRRDPARRLRRQCPGSRRVTQTRCQDGPVRSQGRNRQATHKAGRPVRAGCRGCRPWRLRVVRRRQGRSQRQRPIARDLQSPGGAQGAHVRADGGSLGEASRFPCAGVRFEASLCTRARPSLVGRARRECLRNWSGQATLLPPRLTHYTMRPHLGPTIKWCGIELPRAYRAGNWGNVASVLIKKPARGNFLPIVDGGYSLQYSPLMEYREGKGVMLLCQMDVTGRTEDDPAAERLVANMLDYLSSYSPAAAGKVVYAGQDAGRKHLEKLGLELLPYEGHAPQAGQVLVVGPGAGATLAANADALRSWVAARGYVFAIGLGQKEANNLGPFSIRTQKREYICSVFDPPGKDSLLAGVGPADVHNRDPRQIELVSDGATVVGDGVLALATECQCGLLPTGPVGIRLCEVLQPETDLPAAELSGRAAILGNMGVEEPTPMLERFSSPANGSDHGGRWLAGFYLDKPEEFDDPYRFFPW